MRAIVVGMSFAAAVLAAGAASAQPSFGFTRVNNLTATAVGLEVAWDPNGKEGRGEIRLGEDAAVANHRVVNNVDFCTRSAGERVGIACNAQVNGLTPGRTYYFRTAVRYTSSGEAREALGPVVSFTTPAVDPRNPPSVSYQRVTGYTESWATFNYLVDAFNRPYRTFARCEAAGAPAVQSPAQDIPPHIGMRNIYVRIDGLRPSTDYVCALTAQSDYGSGSAPVSVRTDSP